MAQQLPPKLGLPPKPQPSVNSSLPPKPAAKSFAMPSTPPPKPVPAKPMPKPEPATHANVPKPPKAPPPKPVPPKPAPKPPTPPPKPEIAVEPVQAIKPEPILEPTPTIDIKQEPVAVKQVNEKTKIEKLVKEKPVKEKKVKPVKERPEKKEKVDFTSSKNIDIMEENLRATSPEKQKARKRRRAFILLLLLLLFIGGAVATVVLLLPTDDINNDQVIQINVLPTQETLDDIVINNVMPGDLLLVEPVSITLPSKISGGKSNLKACFAYSVDFSLADGTNINDYIMIEVGSNSRYMYGYNSSDFFTPAGEGTKKYVSLNQGQLVFFNYVLSPGEATFTLFNNIKIGTSAGEQTPSSLANNNVKISISIYAVPASSLDSQAAIFGTLPDGWATVIKNKLK